MKWLFLFMVFLLGTKGYNGCQEEERWALLQLKNYMLSLSRSYYNSHSGGKHFLLSWTDDPDSDCCVWQGVTCNRTTGHVIKLNLYRSLLVDYCVLDNYYDGSIWFVNASLFQPFKELRFLNLSSNCINGWSNNNHELSGLKNLEILDLGSNYLNDSSMPSISGLTSLKKLILARNYFQSFPIEDLSRLKSLEILDFSENWCCDSIAAGSRKFSNLSSLKYLDLRRNYLGKESFRILGRLSSLKYLDVSLMSYIQGFLPIQELSNLSNLEVLKMKGCFLNGTLHIQDFTNFSNLQVLDLGGNYDLGGSILPGLCGLFELQEIDLSYNNFKGTFPPCLNKLKSLKVLDLSGNKLTGPVSSSAIAGMTSLKYIDLSYNFFEGLFSFGSFANHPKLEVVQFINGSEKFEIETEDPIWTPQFQLKVLILSNCNLNKLTHKIPSFLLHQRQLKVVDLSHNKLTGRFPSWLLANNTRLEILSLRNNSLSGKFKIHYPSVRAISLDVSDNQIEGQLQDNVGKQLPGLKYLNLSKNAFQGNLSTSISDIRSLEALDLSSNNFSGEANWVRHCINLEALDLSSNNFQGKFFSTHYNWSALLALRLSNNKFTGTLPNINFNSFSMSLFDISNNHLPGKIPNWIGNMTRLQILDMRDNSFQGKLSCGPFSATYVDLSHNLLSGSLPSCSNMEHTEQIHLQQNKFTGPIPEALLNLSGLLALNIRDNGLSGKIPDRVGALSSLRVLLLSGNHLGGFLPKQLCQLQNLSLMDVSRNSFSGSIPPCFHKISFGMMRPNYQSIAEKSILLPSWTMIYVYPSKLYYGTEGVNGSSSLQVEVEFVTKNRSSFYRGDILNFMSGLDLSCNNLTGKIPPELGKLSWIHALNLSRNQLTGPIPVTFSKLTQIESLDLSHNNLSGEIPTELTELYFLSSFSVAYNNLSGRAPDRKAQFGTFDSSSYEGNPYLCGPPSDKNCSGDNKPPSAQMTLPPHEADGKWYEIDHVVFFASFAVSFCIFFLGVITLLYVNPYWRRRRFYRCEELMFSWYYFIYDTISKMSAWLCS